MEEYRTQCHHKYDLYGRIHSDLCHDQVCPAKEYLCTKIFIHPKDNKETRNKYNLSSYFNHKILLGYYGKGFTKVKGGHIIYC